MTIDYVRGVTLSVDFERVGREVLGYSLVLLMETDRGVETIRVYDSTHGFNEMHRYTRGGTFVVTLRVMSDTGLTATTSRQLTVSTTLPAGSANFVFSPTDPHTGDTVFFNASSSTITDGSYSWDFGDGTRGSGVNPTHSFGQARTFTVSMTVRNALGQSATISKTVTVVE